MEQNNYVEPKKSSNIFLIFIIIILIFIIAGLSYYTFVYKNTTSKEEKTSSETVEKEEKDATEESEELDINNPYIKFLFSYIHGSSTGIDTNVFGSNKKSVNEMTELEKTALAANFYNNLATLNGEQYTLKESDVKKYYELIFGNNTYKHLDEISYTCGTAKYNGTNYIAVAGCGGATSEATFENIIKATKDDDKIEITTVYVFVKDGKYYKDLTFTEELGNYTGTSLNDTTTATTFINANIDKLNKYKYTYKKDGAFYYYQGFEKIN